MRLSLARPSAPLLVFVAANAALLALTYALSWLPVVTLLVDRPVRLGLARNWLPWALALCALVSLLIAAGLPAERRRWLLLRHFGVYLAVPLIYLTLRFHPGVLRGELGVLYLCIGLFLAVHVSLAVWREIDRWSDGRVAAAVAGLALAVYFIVAPYYDSSMQTNADEPHYLVVTQSLLLDRDLDLRNNYEEHQYRRYHPGTLTDRHAVQVGNALYPIRDPGLPVLALVPFAVAGRLGVMMTMALLGAALAWQLFLLLRDLGLARRVTFLAVTLAFLSHPLLTYTTQIYPSIAAALIFTVALRLMVGDGAATAWRIAGVSALLGLLPWLTVRTWPIVIGTGLVLLGSVIARGRWGAARQSARSGPLALAAATVPFGLLLGGLVLYHWTLFGVPLPNAGYFLIREQQEVAGNPLVGGWGMFFSRVFGLLPYAPIYLLGALGASSLFRRLRRAGAAGAALLLAGGLHLLFIASVAHWHGDWSPPSRNLILGLPLLVAGIAAGLEVVGKLRAMRAIAAALVGLATVWTTSVSLILLAFPALLYNLPDRIRRRESSGQLWAFIRERIGFDPGQAFPPIVRIDESTAITTALWLLAVLLLIAVGVLTQRDRAQPIRQT